MSQRSSGYKRKRNDAYDTPAWVTEALIPHLPQNNQVVIWEPAAGKGGMADVLAEHYIVERSDRSDGHDFLSCDAWLIEPTTIVRRGIVTNPPFDQAQEFIEHALQLTHPNGFVAMLLRVDYDSARSRKLLFDGSCFAKKLVLTRRIIWFPRSGAAPSFNHAWFLWDWHHSGPPTIAYSS